MKLFVNQIMLSKFTIMIKQLCNCSQYICFLRLSIITITLALLCVANPKENDNGEQSQTQNFQPNSCNSCSRIVLVIFYTISILLIRIFHLVHHLKWDLAIHVHQTWQPYRGTPVFSKTFLAYLSKGVCAPVWDDMHCLPPTPAGVMAVFPCNTGPKGKKKSKWGNPVKNAQCYIAPR